MRIHTLGEHVLNTCTEHNYTSSGSGTALNTLGYRACALTVTATITGTGDTLVGQLQESSDNSSFANVAGATFTLTGTQTGTVQTASINIGNGNRKQYLRLVYTISGTVHATNVWQLTNPQMAPVVQVPALAYW